MDLTDVIEVERDIARISLKGIDFEGKKINWKI